MSKIIIALTGGIGSGKTAILKMLYFEGINTISCDAEYKALLRKHSVKAGLKKLFPDSVKGNIFIKIDKERLSKTVFGDSEAREKLDQFTHPLIMERAIKKAKKSKKEISIIEIPLLFESNYQNQFKNVIIVKRNIEDRILSVIKRSGLTKEEVLNRIGSQIDYDGLDCKNYVVIDNDGDKPALKEKVLRAIEEIKKKN